MLLAATAVLLMAGPALAQSTARGGCYHNGIPDCGPVTPGANSAFNGGGMVLVNPNGGPPPRATEPFPPPPPGYPPYYQPR